MTTYVALLRAVNVGGRNSVPMARLRAAVDESGLEDVSTILQSGNVVFRSSSSVKAVTALVGDTIEEEFGLRVGVIVRSAKEIAAAAADNPFLEGDGGRDLTTLHVAFLTAKPTAAAIARIDPERSPPDAALVRGREAYLSYPRGSGRSRLTLDYLERTLGVDGTARNWRTVLRLVAAVAERRAP